jgi:hypothetical protein
VPERRWPTHQDLIVCPQEDAEAFASPQDGRERQPPILKAVPPAVEEWPSCESWSLAGSRGDLVDLFA